MQRSIRDQKNPDLLGLFWHETGKPIRDFVEPGRRPAKRRGCGKGTKTGKADEALSRSEENWRPQPVRSGIPETVAMRIPATRPRLFDRYNIVSEADLKDVARRLGDYLGAERSGNNPHTIFGTKRKKVSSRTPKCYKSTQLIGAERGT